MMRNAKFWVGIGIFQVLLGLAVFAITRDYYKVENSTPVDQAEASIQTDDRFSSINPALLGALDTDADLPQDPLEISRRANEHFANRRYARAADLYQKLLTFDPENVDILNNLGLTLHYVGRSEEALQRLNDGVALAPDYQRIWLTLGFVNSSVGNMEEAREALSTAIEMGADSDVGRSASRMLDELPQ